jgi:hypothetical protein
MAQTSCGAMRALTRVVVGSRRSTNSSRQAPAQMGAVLSRGGDHVAVLQRFVSNLVPDDEAALRALLTERD